MKRSVTASPIAHLIVLCMGNRSFDHYLGALSLEQQACGVDGLCTPPRAIPDEDGVAVPNWQIDQHPASGVLTFPELPHDWEDCHADWNGGKNNGFVRTYQAANPHQPPQLAKVPMGYYTRNTLSALYSLADQFVVCDRWHCSVLSSTWPNRKYLHSGTRDADRDTQMIPGITGVPEQSDLRVYRSSKRS